MLHLHSRRYPSGRRSGDIFRRICALQPTYSSDDTPQMQERGLLIPRDLVEELRGITRGSPFLVRLLSSLSTVASISTSHRRAAFSLHLAPVTLRRQAPPWDQPENGRASGKE